MTTLRFFTVAFFVSLSTVLVGCNGDANSPTGEPASRSDANKSNGGFEGPTIITVKPNAVATINQIVAGQEKTGTIYLRVRVVPGGCEGYLHKLDLENVVSFDDQVFESDGVKVVVFKRQIEMLQGTEVDYGQKDGVQGFIVNNPNFTGAAAKRWLAKLESEKDIK